MNNALKITFVYCGALIGAGFASGREIYSFFVKYGEKSIWGVLFTCILFALCLIFVMLRCKKNDIQSFEDYLTFIGNKVFSKISSFLIISFLPCMFLVMTSGGGAIFFEQLQLPSFFGSIAVCAISFLVICFGMNGLVNASKFLTAFMLVGIAITGVLEISLLTTPVFHFHAKGLEAVDNYVVQSILYTSYNFFSASVILISLRKLAKTNKTIYLAGIFSFLFFFVSSFVIWFVLLLNDSNIRTSQLPYLASICNLGDALKYLYIVVLFFAILTTAISCLYAFCEKIYEKLDIHYKTTAFIVCIFCISVKNVEFTVLVEKVYGFFGYLGILLIALVLKDGIKLMFSRD